MTPRESLAWNNKKATAITLAGFVVFVAGVWLANLNIVPLAPQLVMLPGSILFVLSIHYVRMFACRCVQCGAAWESLANYEKDVRYCPSCGYDYGETDKEREVVESSQNPVIQLRHILQSAMHARSSWDESRMPYGGPKALMPFFCLAVTGLILSLVVHLFGSLGLPQPLGGTTFVLHIGIFIVCWPVVALQRYLGKGFMHHKGVNWEVELRGCPAWMRILTYGFGVYAITNFITFMFAVPAGPQVGPPPPIVFRGFSGHWMVFYSIAMTVLYSAWVVSKRDPARPCPNSHMVLPNASYCERCGAWMEEFKDPEIHSSSVTTDA